MRAVLSNPGSARRIAWRARGRRLRLLLPLSLLVVLSSGVSAGTESPGATPSEVQTAPRAASVSSRAGSLSRVAAGGAGAGLELVAASLGDRASRPGSAVELQGAGAASGFPSAYGLGVVELPDFPPDVPARSDDAAKSGAKPAAGPRRDGCPVEVRGIIMGDSPATTFAILAVGGRTELLGAGQGARTRAGWVAVSAIARDHVVIRYGSEAFQCPLRGSTSGVRHDPER